MTIVDRVTARFHDIVGTEPRGVWSAPGRVNIIGDHTDYNGGFALPMAINRNTVVAVDYRDDGLVRLGSTLNDTIITTELARCVPGSISGRAAYPLGVLWALGGARGGMRGLDIVLDTDIPIGVGLSSSAAIECAVAVAVDDLWDLGLNRMEMAHAGQRAENDMVGIPTGMMDQIACLYGEVDSAVFVDCQLPEASTIPFALESEGLAVLVINTHVPHSNSTSGYHNRRATCDRAAAAMGADQLRDLAVDDLPKLRASVDDETFRRARHVVTENARVLAVVDLLRQDGPHAIGDFLVASHLSMKNDFEISIPQIDVAVQVARGAGALGARMTGGGFGGAAIALTPRGLLPAVEHAVREAFSDHSFEEPDMFVVTPSRGAHRVY